MKKDHHFHPSFILVQFINNIKGWLFLFLLAFVVQINNDSMLWVIIRYGLIGTSIFLLLSTFLQWRTTTYRFEDERFILKKGIFSKTRTTIDYDRVQNIQRITPAIQKFLGVTSLRFTTASSASSSAIELTSISKEVADDLEYFVRKLKSEAEQHLEEQTGEHPIEESEKIEEATPTILFQATRKQTIKAAFTSLSFFIVIPFLLYIFDKGTELFHLEDVFEEWFELIIASYIFIIFAVFILILLGITFGLITTYLKYGRFIISNDEKQIYIQRGVLSEQSFTIHKKNVQGLLMKQNIIKRLLKLREVKLVHIGQSGDEDDSIDSLYPFLEEKDAQQLIKQLLPRFFIEPQLSKLPKAAFYLHLFSIPYLFIAVLIAMFIWKFSFWWPTGVLIYTIISRLFTYIFTRYALDGESIVYKTGAWSTEMFITNRNNVIELSFNQNPFQRLFRVCTIEITTRAQPVHVVNLEHVPVSFAEDVLHWYEKREIQIADDDKPIVE